MYPPLTTSASSYRAISDPKFETLPKSVNENEELEVAEVVLRKKTRKANATKWVKMEDAAMDEVGFGSGRMQARRVKNIEGLQ
ncbi:hypothetical protein ACFX16_009450 [Malus domestica]